MRITRGAAVVLTAALPVFGLAAGCSSSGEAPAGSDRSERTEQTAPVSPTTPSPARSTAPSAPPATTGNGIRVRPAEPPTAAEVVQPNRMRLESIGVDVPVVAVGVAADGQMELPPNPAVIGWYRFGPSTTDQRGSVVLGGHLDSKQYGVGPLVRLRKLRPGDLVTVRLSDNSTTSYRVRTVEDIAKSSLALDRVFDRDGTPLLRIITCGGPYDRTAGGYRDNLVVTAAPT
ncbi:MAG TPA: sortase [Kribbella sp.]